MKWKTTKDGRVPIDELSFQELKSAIHICEKKDLILKPYYPVLLKEFSKRLREKESKGYKFADFIANKVFCTGVITCPRSPKDQPDARKKILGNNLKKVHQILFGVQ